MLRTPAVLFPLILSTVFLTAAAQAQTVVHPAQTHGTQVIVPALGSVTHANDQAHVSFEVEEQDKDKTVAASRANVKMKQGIEILKREDPSALLTTRGYYTYPVYADNPGNTIGKQKPIGWRVGQHLEMTTTNLDGLPKTVAAAQQSLTLNGLQFGLTPATDKLLDSQQIEAAYQNLTNRIAAIAKAMGRNASDGVLDAVDFEGSGAYAAVPQAVGQMRFAAAVRAAPQQVEEASFEPGETTRELRIIGKLTFK